MTVIIDYDAGNIKSVEKALLFLGEDVVVTGDPETILSADHVILPGVGAFGDAMKNIRGHGLEEVILKGHIKRIPDGEGLKIPHIGWNSLSLSGDGRLFLGLPAEPYVYFVHSYYLEADDPSIVKAVTEYGTAIHASVEQGNVFACQFHPEKSSEAGLSILRNFLHI